MLPGRTYLQVHNRLAVVLCRRIPALHLLPLDIENAQYIAGYSTYTIKEQHPKNLQNDEVSFQPPGLRMICGFCEDLMHDHAFKRGKILAICSGSHPKDITNTAVLVGGFMILYYGLDVADVLDAFEPISHSFVRYEDALEVSDCLSALHHVSKNCGWLKLSLDHLSSPRQHHGDPDEHDPTTIDMEEYAHYDNPLNGSLHILVPDKLLALPCPADLPAGALWADAAGARAFSPAYYADILGDFAVAVVVRACDGTCAGYDPSPFAAQGIAVEDLDLDRGGAPTLSAADRFLSLARRAPGAVAVHGAAGGGGLGAAAGALVAAHLMAEHAFPAGAAVAWLRIAHPAEGGRT
jgi:hypothetical protein